MHVCHNRMSPGTICVLILTLAGISLELQAGEPSGRLHRLLAVGDIMLSGSAEPVLAIKGYAHAFRDRDLARIISGADAAFCNLEHPVTRSGTPYRDKEYRFRGTNESLRAIRAAGFDLLSLANNHIMDYGPQGLADTVRQCRENGLVCAGAGPDLQAACKAGILTKNGMRYGLLAYSLTLPEDFWATRDRPGTAHPDIASMELDIRALRPAVDILIVSFHWGEELVNEPRPYQLGFARYAVKIGADVVIGHHPHVVQPVEIYHGKPIVYSLGNYSFGSYSDHATTGLAAEIVFHGREPFMVNLYPLNVNNKDVGFQPRIARGHAAKEIIRHLRGISSPLNTDIEFEHGIGKIRLSHARVPPPAIASCSRKSSDGKPHRPATP